MKGIVLGIFVAAVIFAVAGFLIIKLVEAVRSRPKVVVNATDPRSPLSRDFSDRYEQLAYLLLQIWASDVTRAQLSTNLAAKLGGYFGTRNVAPAPPQELERLVATVTRLEDWLQEVAAIRDVHRAMPEKISRQVDAYLSARRKRIGN